MIICPLTGLESRNYTELGYYYQYEIEYDGDIYQIIISSDYANFSQSANFKEKVYLLGGAILNGQLIDEKVKGENLILIDKDWEEKLAKIIYPKTPKDKMDNLLKTLYQFQNYEGEEVDISDLVRKPSFWYKHFFKNDLECYYYFRILKSQNLIEVTIQQHTNTPMDYQLTMDGLNYYIEIAESGRLSNKCFIAMSFSAETKEIREAIREALVATKFDPIIIDEQHIDSHKTINDAIIAELKSAKFCIADFTEQKKGVYFESGFALGQGKPVIYCCRNDHWNDTHFDTKHFAHILYDNPSELKDGLINKINAWIK